MLNTNKLRRQYIRTTVDKIHCEMRFIRHQIRKDAEENPTIADEMFKGPIVKLYDKFRRLPNSHRDINTLMELEQMIMTAFLSGAYTHDIILED